MNENEVAYYKTKSAYNTIAPTYANKYQTTSIVQKMLDEFTLKIPDKGLILDAGCGHGRDLSFFETKSFISVGIDNSSSLLEIAKKNTRSTLYEMDLRYIDFDINFFHGIWANAVLHHILDEDLPNILSRLYGILRPHGVIFISVRNRETQSWDNKYDSVSRYFNYFDFMKLTQLLKDSNFVIDSVQEKDMQWLHVFASKNC